MIQRHRVVIVGGGFGGLYAALALRRAPVDLTLVDKRNFHLFQPLLYQVATGGLSPANIASPLRVILSGQENARVLLGEVTGFDLAGRRAILTDGEVPYDSLIVAAGSSHKYFGHDDWAALAPGLKTLEDATEIRQRILVAFEAAERETDPERIKAWLTFVVVGGGPTGVELAGALAEISRRTLKGEFSNFDPSSARIVLLGSAARTLPTYPEKLSEKAAASLKKLGVEVRSGARVVDVRPDDVVVRSGDREERLATRTVLWAAGIQASPLGRILSEATGAPLDRAGRVAVGPDLSLPGHPEVFVAGDLALYEHQGGTPLPGVAQVAIQEGRHAARVIADRLQGRATPSFHYRDFGSMATIGRSMAVADLGPFEFDGFLAWLAWLFVHLVKLIALENKVLVFVQWVWSYVSNRRGVRLITGKSPLPFRRPPGAPEKSANV